MAHPDILNHRRAKQAVNDIASILKDNQPISIGEVIKGGSLGHGTAVPGDFDLDIVIYSPDVDTHTMRYMGFGKWLDILERFLKRLPDRVRNMKRTKYSVQFKFDDIIDVDLLVSPYWNNQHEFYDFLRGVPQEERYEYSVCASKWQVEFFEQQPNQVKELIKRAKAWRNKLWRERRLPNKPKSYLISLLVLKAYEKASRRVGTSNPRKIAEATMQELKALLLDRRGLDVYWEKYYSVGHGCSSGPNLFPTSLPRIVDPANPANNLFETGVAKARGERGDGWSELVQNIDSVDLLESV